jgi:hypothetical protein
MGNTAAATQREPVTHGGRFGLIAGSIVGYVWRAKSLKTLGGCCTTFRTTICTTSFFKIELLQVVR